MKLRPTLRSGREWLLLLCYLLPLAVAASPPSELKFEALLIWATNNENSRDKEHKPVDADVRKKLDELPLKWKYYYAVKRVPFCVPKGGTGEAVISDQCKLRVKHIDGKNIEVSMVGKGKPTVKVPQPLPKGDMLVVGGNAPESSGWLVVLKRLE